MKTILKYLLLLLIVLPCSLKAQETSATESAEPAPKYWKWSGIVGLNASATGLWNWSAGGKNNVSGVAFGKIRCLYDKDNLNWETNLDVEYGLTWIDQEADKMQKASDHLKFDTKLGWQFSQGWNLTVSGAFQTQMAYGFNYNGTAEPDALISSILAPSYTDVSVGIDWKPNSIFSLYLSPVAGRVTTAYVSDHLQNKYAGFARDIATYMGMSPEEVALVGDYDLRSALQEKNGTWHYDKLTNQKVFSSARAELGLNFKGGINYTYKDLKLVTTLALFTPYTWDKTRMYFNEGTYYTQYEVEQMVNRGEITWAEVTDMGYRDNNRRFGNFDVDWSVAISYKFLKCLNVTLSTNLMYVNGLKIEKTHDGITDSKERVQFKAILGLGVGYSF